MKWMVTFAYSGSSQRKFFTKEFEVKEGDSIDRAINRYVDGQNVGEAKSDRIRYFSKKKIEPKQ